MVLTNLCFQTIEIKAEEESATQERIVNGYYETGYQAPSIQEETQASYDMLCKAGVLPSSYSFAEQSKISSSIMASTVINRRNEKIMSKFFRLVF